MRIAIVGHGGSGKSEVSRYLSNALKLRYSGIGTSRYAADHIFKCSRSAFPLPHYNNVEECYEDRRNHRKAWAMVIDKLEKDNPLGYYAALLQQSDVIDGLRRNSVLEAFVSARAVDLVIQVVRDVPVDPTYEISPNLIDLVVPNYGTTPELHRRLDRILAACKKAACNRQQKWDNASAVDVWGHHATAQGE